MKKILLFFLACLIAFPTFAQNASLKKGIPTFKANKEKRVSEDPISLVKKASFTPAPKKSNNTDNPNIVTVLNLGSSANGYGYGMGGGQRTMVWADDNLKAVINLHRMGPGSTPPSFSGYLAIDLGTNMGMSQTDWQNNRQIYAATLNTGGTYYSDAARYPNAAIYNPEGNTSLANAYVSYYAANLSNGGTWGGYSIGTDNLVNQADSVKHMKWFDPPPYTYIPDGYTIARTGGIALGIDKSYDETNGYYGGLVLGRGVWNSTTHDFAYTYSEIPLASFDNNSPADERIAFSPDGQTAWIVALSQININIDSNYYPILWKSTDAGLTWEGPIEVVLDGPNGIPGITQHLLSDYNITQLYNAPYPSREEIPYTTSFDCRLAVDKWGNPHIGVVIGLCPGGFSIATADSAYAVYDVYSTDGGSTWDGQLMGYPTTFRGTFGDVSEDNRTCIATNWDGDKVFVSWNDTQVPGITDNSQCDVFSRGFDLVQNKITKNSSGDCQPDNVTFLSDITQQATFQCMSPYTFTSNGKWYLPICTELCRTAGDLTQPVDFKYIPDFSYSQSDFTCDVFSENNTFPVSVEKKQGNTIEMSIYPNPFKGMTSLSVNLPKAGNVSVSVTNIVGQKIMNLDKGYVQAGKQVFTIDGSNLNSGVYFCTVTVDGKSYSEKIIVR